jgi:hypothetical protein
MCLSPDNLARRDSRVEAATGLLRRVVQRLASGSLEPLRRKGAAPLYETDIFWACEPTPTRSMLSSGAEVHNLFFIVIHNI